MADEAARFIHFVPPLWRQERVTAATVKARKCPAPVEKRGVLHS